jgi:hypothetical protein
MMGKAFRSDLLGFSSLLPILILTSYYFQGVWYASLASTSFIYIYLFIFGVFSYTASSSDYAEFFINMELSRAENCVTAASAVATQCHYHLGQPGNKEMSL